MCQSGELLRRVGRTANPQFGALGLHESSVLVANRSAERSIFSHFPSAFFLPLRISVSDQTL